jgi:hypothetical protein
VDDSAEANRSIRQNAGGEARLGMRLIVNAAMPFDFAQDKPRCRECRQCGWVGKPAFDLRPASGVLAFRLRATGSLSPVACRLL